MNKVIVASLVALTLSAPAVAADFTGARVGVNLGFADDDFAGTEAFTYGVEAGYDFDLGTTIAGVTAEYQDSSEDGLDRDLSVAARLGFKAGENALVYGLVGYTNLKAAGFKLDGARLGAGAEFALGTNAYAKAEYRYSDYELGLDAHQMLAGVGFRF